MPSPVDTETLLRARAVFILCVVYLCLSIGIMISVGFSEFSGLRSFTTGSISLLGIMVTIALLRNDKNPSKAGTVISLAVTISLLSFLPLTGGIRSPVMVLVVLMPVTWTLLMSVRSSAILTSGLFIFLLCLALSTPSSPVANGAYVSEETLISVLVLSAVISAGVTTTGYSLMTKYALKKAHENSREAKYLAVHDQLTGLPNRHAYYQKAAEFTPQDFEDGVVFYVIDLNEFKATNDTYGHIIGDRVLRIAARRLRSLQRERDWVARMGGDEFIVISKSNNHPAESYEMATRLLNKLSEPYQVDELSLNLSASVGIACSPDHGTSLDTLGNHADLALFAAKQQSQRNWRMFDRGLHENSNRRRVIENRLRLAIQNGQLDVRYQPFVDLARNRVVGFEALARWSDDELGVVSPGEFIEVAEKCGLIGQIGDYVLRRACHDATAWKAPEGEPPLRIAVNVSPHQFSSNQFPHLVKEILDAYQLDPHRLELEITETALMSDTARAIKGLNALEQLGVSVAADDFGTGYSSLSYLKLFPIDRLKIDRSFIRDIEHDANDYAIVKAVLSLAKSMELNIIAEGIETPQQAAILRAMGCHEMQGFLFSRSMVRGEVQGFVDGFASLNTETYGYDGAAKISA